MKINFCRTINISKNNANVNSKRERERINNAYVSFFFFFYNFYLKAGEVVWFKIILKSQAKVCCVGESAFKLEDLKVILVCSCF